jgi:hypothetical protein
MHNKVGKFIKQKTVYYMGNQSNSDLGDVSSSYIGKECFWVDKVTHKKTYDGGKLGKCVDEGIHSLHKLPIVWFERPFLGFTWQYKSDVRL